MNAYFYQVLSIFFRFKKTLKKFEKKRFAKGKTLIFRIETGAKLMDELLFRTKK